MRNHIFMRFGRPLPLPRFVQRPTTSLLVAGVHVYLASSHLSNLLGGGGVHWTDIWKGFGALAGAYVFTALASRGLARQRAPLARGEAGQPGAAELSATPPVRPAVSRCLAVPEEGGVRRDGAIGVMHAQVVDVGVVVGDATTKARGLHGTPPDRA